LESPCIFAVIDRCVLLDVPSYLFHQERLVSNYDYLMYLNLAAGRSFCDLTQWPVMPWVICDYKSSKLDLKDPSVYRDLSKVHIFTLTFEVLDLFCSQTLRLCSICRNRILHPLNAHRIDCILTANRSSESCTPQCLFGALLTGMYYVQLVDVLRFPCPKFDRVLW